MSANTAVNNIFADISQAGKDLLRSVFCFHVWYGGFTRSIKGCLLDCFHWELNYCIVLVHWCSVVWWCSNCCM